jgi:hypothetical protein
MTNKQSVSGELKTLPLLPFLYVAFLLNVLVLVTVYLKSNTIPPEVPLFYGNPDGIDQLASWQYLFLPPTISLLFLTLNTILAVSLTDKFIRYTLSATSFALSILTTIAVVKALLLVGSLF